MLNRYNPYYPYSHPHITAYEGGYERIVIANTAPGDTVYVEGRELLDGDRLGRNWIPLPAVGGVIELTTRDVTYGVFRVWVNYKESGAWFSTNSPVKEYYNPIATQNAGNLEIDIYSLKPNKFVTFDNTVSSFAWTEKIMWLAPTCPDGMCKRESVPFGKRSRWNLDEGSLKGGFWGTTDGVLLAREDWGPTISVIFLSGGSRMTPDHFMGFYSSLPYSGVFTFSKPQFAALMASGRVFDLVTRASLSRDYSRRELPEGFQVEQPQQPPLPERPPSPPPSNEAQQRIYQLLGLQNTVNPTDWEILGIDEGSDKGTIKRAYRQRALDWHPDKNKDPEAEEVFKVIFNAYERLMSLP